MICHVCKLKVHKVYKVIKQVRIYECSVCRLGYIDQNESSKIHSYRNDPRKGLYRFDGYKEKEKKLRKIFGSLVEIIKKYKKQGKVLDVGAGFGLFSSVLSKEGSFKLEILEPMSFLQYLILSKQKVYKTNFEDFKGQQKSYDVIMMIDVLEHFKNPAINLKKAKDLLKDDGILVIQTPNYKSLMARICRDWAWWMIEDHKFFFSPKSMKKILYQTGFKPEFIITYEDWYDFKKNLDGNFVGIKNNLVKKTAKGLFFGIFFLFYFLLRHVIWRMEYGGLMFVIAKKNYKMCLEPTALGHRVGGIKGENLNLDCGNDIIKNIRLLEMKDRNLLPN